MPFARASSLDLAACGIQQADWLSLLDELNIAMVGDISLCRILDPMPDLGRLRIMDLAGYARG